MKKEESMDFVDARKQTKDRNYLNMFTRIISMTPAGSLRHMIVCNFSLCLFFLSRLAILVQREI
jgi:hypothetical protein